MYGGSGKLGRGGGRGSKRNNSPYPPPPLHRSIPPQSGRLSIGGGGSAPRNRQSANTMASASKAPLPAPEETFNLVSGDPLAFAMIIRLAPNLVDEIRRVEAQGGTARIKFDPYANNPAGNVIDVGGKDFRFTWSHEPGDLCDIYEERQSGEKGSGLLVESGGAWRKLNVQRVLDESTKNHVKMRSEEAERKLKARKAIVLDHGNPSVNNQMKTPATSALEGRMAPKPRKEPPFKKRKVEPPQASGGPPKSVYKSGLSSTTTVKGRLSVSPVPSPPEQSRRSASPFGLRNLSRGQISVEEVIAPQVTSKEESSNTEKEIHSRVVHAAVPPGKKEGLTASPVDLRSMVVTLLTENPKGLGIKALEKVVGDSTVKIKPILEKIATYQAPGRYILKEGVELESFKKPAPDSGSSPECVPDQAANLEKASPNKFELQSQLSPQLEVSKLVEKIDNQHNSPDLFGDKKATAHSVERAGSSSDSGSGSDSDSDSDSGSDSGSQSRSRSKSPAGSGSGSSSDSESDGSSSNKQGSDVDVDIMTSDDDKEDNEHKVHNPELVLSTSPLPWKIGSQNEFNGANEDKQVGQVYNAIGISKESPVDANETGLVDMTDSTPLRENVRSSQERMPFSPDLNPKGESQQFSAGDFTNKRQNKEDVGLEHYDSSERISSSMMSSGLEYFDEKSGSGRRMKAGRLAQPLTFGRNKETMFVRSPNYLSPNRPPLDPSKDRNLQAMDRVGDATADAGSQRGCDSSMPGRFHSDAQQSSQRHADLRTPGIAHDVMERPKNSVQNPGRNNKNFGRGFDFQDESDESASRSNHAYDKFSTNKDKVYTETLDEVGHAYEKSLTKNVRQGAVGDKTSMPFKSQYRKQDEQLGKFKDAQQMTKSHFDAFPNDGSRNDVQRSLAVNGRGNLLRRELSELELGEFREPTDGEEHQGSKKKFEKKNSFKLSESVSNASDHLNPDSNKGRATGKMNQELRKQLSPDSGVGVFGNQEDSYRKRIIGDDITESTRPQQTASLPEVHQFPRVDHAGSEVGFEPNKPADRGTKSRKSESRKSQGMGPDSFGGTSRKASVNVPQQHGTKSEGGKVNTKTIRESKSRKSNSVAQLTNRKDNFWTENNNSSQKRRELSADEDNCTYFKYEKDGPELKGPIKDFSQYKEYVQEYREKYGTYCSLNKSLETYRTDFSKLGHDLQLAKDRDMGEYYDILEQLRGNYRLCGKRHRRLKKIFLVLHEELKCLKKSIKDFAVSYTKD